MFKGIEKGSIGKKWVNGIFPIFGQLEFPDFDELIFFEKPILTPVIFNLEHRAFCLFLFFVNFMCKHAMENNL